MVANVAKSIIEKQHPTILVNNAGIVTGKKLVDASIEEMERYYSLKILKIFIQFLKHLGPSKLMF